VGGVVGTVRSINIRSTIIETPERALVYVPNSNIMSNQFSNWTSNNSRMVRRSISISVAYNSDMELVTKLLLQAAEEQKHVLKLPAPAVLFNNFSPNSMDFTLNIFIDDVNNSILTLSDVRASIQKLFAENCIRIPLPQMSLHMPETAGSQEPYRPKKPILSSNKPLRPSRWHLAACRRKPCASE
jgi:small-conductance mechanosensitive channel